MRLPEHIFWHVITEMYGQFSRARRSGPPPHSRGAHEFDSLIPIKIWREICSICGDLNGLTQLQFKQIQMFTFPFGPIDAYLERNGFYDIDLDGPDHIDLIETAKRMLGNQEVQDLNRRVQTRLELFKGGGLQQLSYHDCSGTTFTQYLERGR